MDWGWTCTPLTVVASSAKVAMVVPCPVRLLEKEKKMVGREGTWEVWTRLGGGRLGHTPGPGLLRVVKAYSREAKWVHPGVEFSCIGTGLVGFKCTFPVLGAKQELMVFPVLLLDWKIFTAR